MVWHTFVRCDLRNITLKVYGVGGSYSIKIAAENPRPNLRHDLIVIPRVYVPTPLYLVSPESCDCDKILCCNFPIVLVFYWNKSYLSSDSSPKDNDILNSWLRGISTSSSRLASMPYSFMRASIVLRSTVSLIASGAISGKRSRTFWGLISVLVIFLTFAWCGRDQTRTWNYHNLARSRLTIEAFVNSHYQVWNLDFLHLISEVAH